MGLEPLLSRTRPLNVRVCRFRHTRINMKHFYDSTNKQLCQHLENFFVDFLIIIFLLINKNLNNDVGSFPFY